MRSTRKKSRSRGLALSALVLLLAFGWAAAPSIFAVANADLVCPLCDEPAPTVSSVSGLINLIVWTMLQEGVSFVLMGAVAIVGLPWLIAGGAIAILSIPRALKLL